MGSRIRIERTVNNSEVGYANIAHSQVMNPTDSFGFSEGNTCLNSYDSNFMPLDEKCL